MDLWEEVVEIVRGEGTNDIARLKEWRGAVAVATPLPLSRKRSGVYDWENDMIGVDQKEDQKAIGYIGIGEANGYGSPINIQASPRSQERSCISITREERARLYVLSVHSRKFTYYRDTL